MAQLSTDDTKAIGRHVEMLPVLKRLAIFGNSIASLVGSLLLMLCAIAIHFYINPLSVDKSDPYTRLGPIPALSPHKVYDVGFGNVTVTEEMLDSYQRDGAIAIRGLLKSALLEKLDEAAKELSPAQKKNGQKRQNTQFSAVRHGVIFLRGANDEETSSTAELFQQLAMRSAVPAIAAALLSPTVSLRLFRDILLAKDTDPYVCGWHVDDFGFWPADPDAPGVNAWVALSDMPIETGGGFALAVGSHRAIWRDEAHHVTGASTTFPREGYRSAADLFAKRTGSGTCNLRTAAPHLHQRMEEIKRVYEVKRGDVIFHDRWMFHRTVPFKRDFANENPHVVYRRYSMRYNAGSATIPMGYGTEPSVLWDETNGGRTADAVSYSSGPWYPQVWPNVDFSELQQLQELIEKKRPVALERQDARFQEMRPYLKQLARSQ